LSKLWIEPYWSIRKVAFLARLYLNYFIFQSHFRFGHDFKFWLPGLETKFALEAAEKVGAEVKFMGAEINPVTYERLYHETRFNALYYLMKRFQYFGGPWGHELASNRHKLHLAGAKTFTEKCLDTYLINWYIQSLDIFFPRMKEIFVDKRDQDLFAHIDNCEGKKVVAVVNFWHMEGIEHHWCHRYGQVPRSVVFSDGINPIGDMNLREGLFQRLYNYVHREISSSNSRSTPSTYADWIIGYHRESNWQYEHRDM
jgi:pheromone shutdown protein TraB